jgi:asparagine synthase (glutamine-hydrolysing)
VCGIVGIKKIKNNPTQTDVMRVENALTAQVHRGSDASRVLTTGKAVFGHNRLAIIDVGERSNQPFQALSDRYTITFNGEIYNFQQLKNNLLGRGYQFNTSSDTEVLLNHMIEFGPEGISDLEGCFAFAFYDCVDDRLLLVRDRMGINPVLFHIGEEEVCFSSELNAFKWLIDEHEVDETALSYFFRFTYIPAPKTILKNVQKLLPGHYLSVKGSNFDIIKYDSEDREAIGEQDYENVKKELKLKLEHAVISRLNADVPLGAFLSGGLDSSIVAAIAADFKTELATFSVGFEDHPFYDESKYAQMVADHIGSRHYALNLSDDYVVEELPRILASIDEPFADSSSIASFLVAQEASKFVTVCLSGDGADELFAGYNKHTAFQKMKNPGFLLALATKLVGQERREARSSWFANKRRQLKKFKQLQALDWPANYWYLASFVSEEEVSALLEKSAIELPKLALEQSLSHFLEMDQQFVLPNDMLKKVDMTSMANSLEVRVPFLDSGVVKLANALPDQYKNDGKRGKKILRECFADLLPAQLLNRPKQGFEVPLQSWIKKGWSKITREAWFEESYLKGQGLFKTEGVLRMKEKALAKQSGDEIIQLWSYIVFQNWYDRWSGKLK